MRVRACVRACVKLTHAPAPFRHAAPPHPCHVHTLPLPRASAPARAPPPHTHTPQVCAPLRCLWSPALGADVDLSSRALGVMPAPLDAAGSGATPCG